jgi:hypothetical protein
MISSPGDSFSPAKRLPIMTALAPAAIALVMSPSDGSAVGDHRHAAISARRPH